MRQYSALTWNLGHGHIRALNACKQSKHTLKKIGLYANNLEQRHTDKIPIVLREKETHFKTDWIRNAPETDYVATLILLN